MKLLAFAWGLAIWISVGLYMLITPYGFHRALSDMTPLLWVLHPVMIWLAALVPTSLSKIQLKEQK